MHFAPFIICHLFFTHYERFLGDTKDIISILDVGSYDYNGNLRDAIATSPLPSHKINYTGMDVTAGPNVDIVIEPNSLEKWPIPYNSMDVVISSSALEHDNFFWETFVRMTEVVKPGGYMLVIVPSLAPAHKYPVDNWRFYEDAPFALALWAQRNGVNISHITSKIVPQYKDNFMIFQKEHTDDLQSAPATTFEPELQSAHASRVRDSSTESFHVYLKTLLYRDILGYFLTLFRMSKLRSNSLDNEISAIEQVMSPLRISDWAELNVPADFVEKVQCWHCRDLKYRNWMLSLKVPKDYSDLLFVEGITVYKEIEIWTCYTTFDMFFTANEVTDRGLLEEAIVRQLDALDFTGADLDRYIQNILQVILSNSHAL